MLGIFTDPTLGVFASAYTGQVEQNTSIFIKNEFTFYDEEGTDQLLTNAPLSVVSSLIVNIILLKWLKIIQVNSLKFGRVIHLVRKWYDLCNGYPKL